MFNSIYNFRNQKRNFHDDNPLYVPSMKKTRLWSANLDDSRQNCANIVPADLSFIRNDEQSCLPVTNKTEFFPAVCIGINDTIIANDMMDVTKYKYMPDLNAAQNPHYYEYNKLLFELYLERIRRSKPISESSSLQISL